MAPIAINLGLVDRPSGRKLHAVNTPLVGGIGIYCSVVISYIVFDISYDIFWFFVALSIIFLVGILDDAIELSVYVRFICQVITVLMVMLIYELEIRNTGVGLFQGHGIYDVLVFLITLVSMVGLINSINMIDGIDGLASGLTLTAILCLMFAIFSEHPTFFYTTELLILIGSIFGFFIINVGLYPQCRAFLGDCGSLTLGFALGWALIFLSQSPDQFIDPVAALWCVFLPVVDTLWVITLRLKNKVSPFTPDRNHIHLLLVDRFMSPRKTLATLLMGSLVIGFIGIWATSSSSLFGITLFFVLACFYVGMMRRLALKNEGK